MNRRMMRVALVFGSTAAIFGTLLSSSSCQKKAVCDDVVGSCLALTVEGSGNYDSLRTELLLPSGQVRVGSTSGNIDLPLTLRVVPPAGVSSTDVAGVTVTGVFSGADQASGRTPSSFSWPDGAHIEATVSLGASQTDAAVVDDAGVVDQASPDLANPDLSGPPPTLRWTPESTGGLIRLDLYSVWSGGTNQTFAVGGSGLILTRNGTTWSQEASPSTGNLYGVSGFAASGTWSVGPSAYRRAATWTPDATNLMVGPGESLWSVSPGGTAGELWVGADNGKVWRRSGATGGNGTWAVEQALPLGNRVCSVSYSGGTVFAVGQRGWVGVRKSTGGWQNYQYTDLAGSTMGNPDAFFGVSAVGADSAVAVGSKGLAARFTGGSWKPGTVKIDTGGTEFNAIWGSPANRFYAVGYNGVIVRVDGNLSPTSLRVDATQNLYGIFGTSETDIFVVGARVTGDALILHGSP